MKLKKKTEKGEGLRVDAIIFGAEKKNTSRFISKFPLDDYFVMVDDNPKCGTKTKAQDVSVMAKAVVAKDKTSV